MLWSWLLECIGLLGATLAGRKLWFAWLILLANTVLWGVYAVGSHQYGFLAASFVYAPVYARNAYRWKKGTAGDE